MENEPHFQDVKNRSTPITKLRDLMYIDISLQQEDLLK